MARLFFCIACSIHRQKLRVLAHDLIHEIAPCNTADNAVRQQTCLGLVRSHGAARSAAKDAVQSTRAIAQTVQRILQHQHIRAHTPLSQNGIAAASTGRRPAPPVEMHPGSRFNWRRGKLLIIQSFHLE